VTVTPWGLELVEEWDEGLRGGDPLGFPGYADTLAAAGPESSRTGLAEVAGRRVVYVETLFECMAGTMGAATGEKIVRAFDRATAMGLPVVASTGTGGVRLQEGMVALIQMGRTAAARQRHAAAGLLMVAIYGSPTTGGVFASWGSLADIRAARAGATIGFGGPRVVETVTGQLPPATSHTAESAYAAGIVDAVLAPGTELPWLGSALGSSPRPLALSRRRAPVAEFVGAPEVRTGWETVRVARNPARPSGLEWAVALTTSWCDLASTDPSIRAGLATLGERRVVVVAMDRHARGDASARPGPAAFRLAQRAAALAGQLRLPLLTLIDTPGAEPGPKSEAGGIAGEIARTLRTVASSPAVTISICVGEGGSGGAMALGYTDRAFMLHGSVFSVIGPEAAGAVLERDPGRAPAMADALGLTGPDLLRLGIVDDVLPDAGPDATDLVRKRIVEAIDTAAVGDRERRANVATNRWLVEERIAS
jgi:acetyl-CoA carboxylase carboxyl transferase subunit beta